MSLTLRICNLSKHYRGYNAIERAFRTKFNECLHNKGVWFKGNGYLELKAENEANNFEIIKDVAKEAYQQEPNYITIEKEHYEYCKGKWWEDITKEFSNNNK